MSKDQAFKEALETYMKSFNPSRVGKVLTVPINKVWFDLEKEREFNKYMEYLVLDEEV